MSSSALGPCVRQSASLSGMAAPVRLAAFRFASSVCRVETRVRIAWVIFSRMLVTWLFLPPPSNQPVSPSLTTS